MKEQLSNHIDLYKNEWIVEISADGSWLSARESLETVSASLPLYSCIFSRSFFEIRVFISAAAAFVKVTMSISEISARPDVTSSVIRPVRAAVFPLPAAAEPAHAGRGQRPHHLGEVILWKKHL